MIGLIVYRVVGRNMVGARKGKDEAFQLMEPKIHPDWCENTWVKMVARFYKSAPDAAIYSCEKVFVDDKGAIELQNVWFNKALVHIRPQDVLDRLPAGVPFYDIVVECPPEFFNPSSLGDSLDSVEPPLTEKQKTVLRDFKKHEDDNV